MSTRWRTVYQHILAFRLWWRCKRDRRVALRVAALAALLQQDADVSLGRLA